MKSFNRKICARMSWLSFLLVVRNFSTKMKVVLKFSISFINTNVYKVKLPKSIQRLTLTKCILKKTEKRKIGRKRHTQFFFVCLNNFKLLKVQEGSYIYPLLKSDKREVSVNQKILLKVIPLFRYTDFQTFTLILKFIGSKS